MAERTYDSTVARIAVSGREGVAIMATLSEQIAEYVQHKPGCASRWRASTGSSQIGPCDCGLDTLLASLAPREEETRWQDISTAPKDGSNLLLSDGLSVSQGGWLSEVDQGAEYEGQGVVSAGWWSVEGIESPTHWMPLPAAPTPQPQETRQGLRRLVSAWRGQEGNVDG